MQKCCNATFCTGFVEQVQSLNTKLELLWHNSNALTKNKRDKSFALSGD
ncbi:hypothetical protein [Lyngbya sp. PCC 8106]|nr:hypothetical protein [Lyngbya sp. PCC 8106]